MTVLVLTDKLGITDGYRGHWSNACLRAGLNPQNMIIQSIWRDPNMTKMRLLIQKGNRKSPGFNPDTPVRLAIRSWVEDRVKSLPNLEAILCQDVALLGLVESKWDIATIDNLRGGVYDFRLTSDGRSFPFLVTVPISAINTKKSPKDIRAMNGGAEDKDEFDAMSDEDGEEFFMEPYTIPFGRFILTRDLMKLNRILARGLNVRHPAASNESHRINHMDE